MWTAWALALLPLATLAFLLRTLVLLGRTPGGVDTWYYLAYADAVRARPGFDVRLPQYLLQDEWQSYPPLFPMFLALIPRTWRLRFFWAISPAIDCMHLVFLYWLAFKITRSLPVSVVTACVYAFTPQLVSETRSLNGRSFGALLHSVATVLTMRYAMSGEAWPWLPAALVAGAALCLASATSAVAYAIVCAALSLYFGDARYALVAGGAGVLACALSGGHFLRVLRNYVQAVAYWRRNRARFGAHPIRHSPIYGKAGGPVPALKAFLGRNVPQHMLRLLGENPFLLALPLAPAGVPPWGTRLEVWAVVLAVLAALATLVPPLQAFGPGRNYLKAGVFPTAYTLAVGIGGVHGFRTPLGVATLLGLAGSAAAIAFFFVYMRRQRSEQTAFAPDGLMRAVRRLSELPPGGVLCLPYMYADYVCYHAGKPILWGGHSGDLHALEALAPVITEPLPELMRRHGVRYVLLDVLFARPEDVALHDRLNPLGSWDQFTLFELREEALS